MTPGQKKLATDQAAMISRHYREHFGNAAENFSLNPSAANRDRLDQTADLYQEARETQRRVAEWETE